MKNTMNNLIILCWTMFLIPFSLLSQNYSRFQCFTDDYEQPNSVQNNGSYLNVLQKYDDFAYYIPYEYEASALKILNVNFIIVQDDNGEYNFKESNEFDMKTLEDIKNHLNNMYKKIQYPSDPCPGVPYIEHSMIQFNIETFFVKNSYVLDLFQSEMWGSAKDYIVNNYIPNYQNAFNIFFFEYKCAIDAVNNNIDQFPDATEDNFEELHGLRLSYLDEAGCIRSEAISGGSANFPGSILNEGYFSYINERNSYYYHHFDVITNNIPSAEWRAFTCAMNLAHELGHNFELDHTHSSANANDKIADTPYPDSTPKFCDPYYDNGPNYDPCNNWCDSCTNNMMSYSGYELYLSPLQLGRIHRSFSLLSNFNKLYNSPFSETPIEITSDETWDFTFRVFSNIVVKSGATLTITCKVMMPEQASIIVENGGKLVIDGGIVTSVDKSKTWKGIEVWGSTNLVQSGTNYGSVTLNNATIENAETAVILAKRYSPTQGTLDPDSGIIGGTKGTIGGVIKPIKPPVIDANYSGGKIIATNSRFINNKSCVEFYPYNKNNLSYFHSCDFEMNDNIAGASNLVYMNATKGVTFEGCNFKFTVGGTSPSLKGIYASNSSFYVYPRCTHSNIMHVTPYCSNPTLENYSNFENLAYGIYAVGNGGTLPYSVKFTNFDRNNRGVYSSGIDNVSITDCDFKVMKPTYGISSEDPVTVEEDYINYGVYCNGSTGYQIEDNTFTGVDGNSVPGYLQSTYGVIINNSGGAANRIYRNNLNNLEVGVQAQGNNRNASNGVGLCFACNDFSYNRTDISVTANSMNDGNSIASHQKNKDRPAANGFTWDSYQGHKWDFYNYLGGPYIRYHQFISNANGRKYQITKSENSGLQSDNNPNAHEVECPRTPYNYYYNDVISKQSLSENTQNTLDELVDGGNSSEMVLAIDNATSLDANNLGEMLSNNSPYLSNESVKATVANEAAVDNVMLRDVLVGNSHAVRDEEIMRDVNERTNPLPAYMYEQIDVAAGTISGLDLLRIELQETLSDYTNAVTVVAQNSIVNDSIETWELLMSNALNEDLRYGYAVYNAINGNVSSDILASITDLDETYTELLSVLSDSTASSSSNEVAVSSLVSISEQDNRAGVLASTILSDLGYIDYQEPIYKIDDEVGFKHDVVKPVRRVAESMISNINLYPNPAKDYIVVEYNVEGLSDKLTMTISDIEGKMVYSKKLSYSKDSVKIDVKSLTNGNYILNICSECNVVYSKKFVVNNK